MRQATTLPKTNSKEWRNKFICVEGKHLYGRASRAAGLTTKDEFQIRHFISHALQAKNATKVRIQKSLDLVIQTELNSRNVLCQFSVCFNYLKVKNFN